MQKQTGRLDSTAATSERKKNVVAGMIKEQTVLEILRREHREIEELFAKVDRLQDVSGRISLFQQVADKLELHAQGEEMVLYPRLEGTDEMRDIAHASYNDHEDIRRAVGALEAMDRNESGWLQRFRELRERFRAHVKTEEHVIFPKMRELFPENLLIEMGVAVKQSKETFLQAS